MEDVWTSFSPVFLLSLVTSALVVFFTVVFAYRTSKYGCFMRQKKTDVDLDELSDEEKERMSAKPQAAKAAESLIEATMTEEQKTLEKEAQRKQLEEIYRLMAAHSDKFGDTSLEDIVNQMALYR
uniref:Matrix-remodeling-associated protein 7 helical domain-containing protein n=1 Tax=Rhipicephalus zambeziensis TaxID=60191 RepID=A0A224Y8G3_9ACAR